MAKDITQDVAAFNLNVETASNGNRKDLKKSFHGIVQIYSDAKQYGRECIKGYPLILCFVKLAFILQMYLGIQPNGQIFSPFVFLMDNVGYSQHTCDTSI